MSKSTIRNFSIALTLMVASTVAFGFVVFQVNSQGLDLVNQLELAQVQQQQQQSLYQLEKTFEETSETREELQRHFLLKESDSIDFLNQIEPLALSVGVFLDTETLSLTEDGKWIDVRFSASGSRKDVQNFVQILENVSYVSELTAVDMNLVSSKQWRAGIQMKIYVLGYDE